ncbi:hypothetical protein BO78DRAFT_60051 [Aspergillus sclerotiicarbonarius CBS 121057]|uniref:Uncharacterized protein n=1 Tax=Aspergillus sclerotiicarbonarius (strain CBS 121057 / IBT 28362) TaxID=1448318 RepID=A0A319EEJ7_ASPSB|nr:hypothetical protein BO78DRAFT_60051 [Aspergillus sclerotiicarbonarius CBS 121057]
MDQAIAWWPGNNSNGSRPSERRLDIRHGRGPPIVGPLHISRCMQDLRSGPCLCLGPRRPLPSQLISPWMAGCLPIPPPGFQCPGRLREGLMTRWPTYDVFWNETFASLRECFFSPEDMKTASSSSSRILVYSQVAHFQIRPLDLKCLRIPYSGSMQPMDCLVLLLSIGDTDGVDDVLTDDFVNPVDISDCPGCSSDAEDSEPGDSQRQTLYMSMAVHSVGLSSIYMNMCVNRTLSSHANSALHLSLHKSPF